jgi:hypothetical protein
MEGCAVGEVEIGIWPLFTGKDKGRSWHDLKEWKVLIKRAK